MNEERKSGQTPIGVRGTADGEPRHFEVVIQDRDGETNYQVTMSRAVFERLSGGQATPEACVQAAFLFLLDREPKEAILRNFDVAVIERYFPEFFRAFPDYRESVSSAILEV
jgi:hypothetical protein